MRRHRVSIAANCALLMVVGTVVGYAVAADGYRVHEARLNDGGIWVTNSRDGFHGRVNKPIDQVDAVIPTGRSGDIDVVQDGAVIVGLDLLEGYLEPIDPASVQPVEGESAALPAAALVGLNGGTLSVVDPVTGDYWAQRVDPERGRVSVSSLDARSDPVGVAGARAAAAVTGSGDLVVASTSAGTLTRLRQQSPEEGGDFAEPTTRDLDVDLSAATSMTAVGEVAIAWDPESGRLVVLDTGTVHETDLPDTAYLQQPGPARDVVLLGSDRGFHAVDLDTGEVQTLVDGVAGSPADPVVVGPCRYAAWAGQQGAVATQCGNAEPVVAQLADPTEDLVFRVNRGQVLLNDRVSGAVWNVDSSQPARLDDWDAFRSDPEELDPDEDLQIEDATDNSPPQAHDDQFGARPGRTTVLYPLDNDTAGPDRLLSIRAVSDVRGSDAEVTVSPDGQAVLVRLPEGTVGITAFDYTIDDGISDDTSSATVRVLARGDGENGQPHPRPTLEEKEWTVAAGGILDIPVLPDWRDYDDGDPLLLVSAAVSGRAATGAAASPTSAGRIRFRAGPEGGLAKVVYQVSDGIGGEVQGELSVRVLDRSNRRPTAPIAEPDVVAGEVGQPIVIRPLGNDIPGADPFTPDAQMRLAGALQAPRHLEVRTDTVNGVVTVRTDRPGTYFLSYEVAFGNAPYGHGTIRVDARPRAGGAPVAVPDSVTLHGQAPATVDVLANDIDPSGGVLVVERAWADHSDQVDVAVVDGRWLRLRARQGVLTDSPQTVNYSISNGTHSGVRGHVVVNQRPAPEDNTPVTEIDRVTVRAGSAVTVPVLDNDFSPSGDPLSLLPDATMERAGELPVRVDGDEDGTAPAGNAYVSGRFVRYVAPAEVAAAQVVQVTYLATNPAGQTAPGLVEVTVLPEGRNQPPEPPVIEGRMVAGETLRLRLPGAGVDPDGDPVTVTGVRSAAALGRVVRFGANSVEYQAYPTSAGTDEFEYEVTDSGGEVATGTIRIAVVPPASPQAPQAVPDTVTVAPGRSISVEVLDNDIIATGDRVTVSLVDPPDWVRLESDTGPITVDAPERSEGRNREIVYRIDNGIATSQTTLRVRTRAGWNNPPVVLDSFGEREEGDTVTVNVLEHAYDPDGPDDQLRVVEVLAPESVPTSVDGGEITVARGPLPRVVPFTVADSDGGRATAQLFVPATGTGPPYLAPGAMIRLDSGDEVTERLEDLVIDPAGRPVRLTLIERIWASPAGDLGVDARGDDRLQISAAAGYVGPGAVTFEVTNGDGLDDPDGQRAVITVPVQVGDDRPVLRCPDDALEVVQGETLQLDIEVLCHVWTGDPTSEALNFDASWATSANGLSLSRPRGQVIEVAADGAARPGTEGELSLTSGESEPGTLSIRVVQAPPPSLESIQVADMQAGESRVIELAPYLRAGVKDPVPTLISVQQLTGLDVTASASGQSGIQLVAGERVNGRAEFDVVVADVAGDSSGERHARGRITLEILDVPDAPSTPIVTAAGDKYVDLVWVAPPANGAPIEEYELLSSDGRTVTCGSTQCSFGGLTNGEEYSFSVRARNAVGWSDPSSESARAMPDTLPGQVGDIQLVEVGDSMLRLQWLAPTKEASAVQEYLVSYPGITGGYRVTTRPEITLTELDNNRRLDYVEVIPVNLKGQGPGRRSAPMQSIGTPPTPEAPRLTPSTPAKEADRGAVAISWPMVSPNGPGPVRYTVLRNGAELPQCRMQTETRCDDAGISYDGTTYSYSIRATNAGVDGVRGGEPKSATGDSVSWDAVGVPAAWGDWELRPRGERVMDATANRTAEATFTVPASRGAQSRVRVYVNGNRVDEFAATGTVTRHRVTVPHNDGPHTVRLEVCNEAGNCEPSTQKSVQTYGPLVAAHIEEIQAERRNDTEVRWRVRVRTNGKAAKVRVRSGQRDQVLNANTVSTVTLYTNWLNLGYSATESVTVTLYDDGTPSRAGVSKTASTATPAPPPPFVEVLPGNRCQDNDPSLPNCRTGGGGTECLNSSCRFVRIRSRDFINSNRMDCHFYDEANATTPYVTRRVTTNTNEQTPSYYGFAGRRLWVECVGVQDSSERATSARLTWPN
ncbi:Ig-like domain-containing protein [Nocardioides limicola]|uniref:Ig-like domain-containing protein n=1 Tax=Nocardioides limicola TaxID=2803368 RepID=UPI00193C1828|nr:Ig-like domain-containing protein [Nocardioides sp. DJM-14]